MDELLTDKAVIVALATVLVTALNALAAWLKSKFPTQAARVNDNWCYLQPVVDAAMAAAQAAAANKGATAGVIAGIVTKAVTEFADTYRKFEGKDADVKTIEAARVEVTAAVQKTVE